MNSRSRFLCTALLSTIALFCLLHASPLIRVQAAIPAGYSEYYIPGGERQMWDIFWDLDSYLLDIDEGMHAVIAVTAATDRVTVYYDHWENGYNFDPDDPLTADETYSINQGQVQRFESSNIPVNPRGTSTYYDGQDRIYVAGGSVTVTRASWSESGDTHFALAWEIFPTKPFMTHYVIPVGVNLAAAPLYYADFSKAYVIVQSTTDNNLVEIDDPKTPGLDVAVTLDQGEVTDLYQIDVGTTIDAADPVQAQIIVGDDAAHYEARGFTAIPEGMWDNEYYSAVGSFFSRDTEIYLYNGNPAPITIDYEDSDNSGSFAIPANSTLSYSDGSGQPVAQNSGVYLSSDDAFWGVGVGDTGSSAYDWGFSLVPTSALADEYFLGWAPGTSQSSPTVNGSPVFVTPIQDRTVVYVDYGPADGLVDATYTLDRLASQRIFDPDNDNTGMNIWATAPIAVTWGEDPDAAGSADPYVDLGYTTLPLLDAWIDMVLGIEKTADPAVVGLGAGHRSTFTLVTSSHDYLVDGTVLTDTLPPGGSIRPAAPRSFSPMALSGTATQLCQARIYSGTWTWIWSKMRL